jgi:hypothetical protein
MDPSGSMSPGQRHAPIVIGDNGDEDAELQAVLAMSLQAQAAADDEELEKALALSLHGPAAAAVSSIVTDSTNNDSTPPADDEQEVLHSALALSLQVDRTPDTLDMPTPQPLVVLEAEAITDCYRTGEPFDIVAFHKIMWDATLTTENDKNRWVGQGIDIRDDDEQVNDPGLAEVGVPLDEMARLELLAKTHLPWGYVQQHGGPCGVLAAVQAEVLRNLLWGPMPSSSFLSREALLEALARAIGTFLARAALTGPVEGRNDEERTQSPLPLVEAIRLVLPHRDDNTQDRPLTWEDFEPWSEANSSANTTSTKSQSFTVYTIPASFTDRSAPKRQKKDDPTEEGDLEERIDRLAQTVAAFLLQAGSPPPIHHFRHTGGVMLLVMSLVASRTGGSIRQLEEEFDDPTGTRLTAQFGHCGQELLNLLLVGQAVSNVFDHNLKPSGDLICRGISSRPVIGYLTQLESLRYCQVGSYYKSPRFPIWVVGSTSHFTVLFGPMAALRESRSDLVLEQCRRAFKAVEGGDENGFIATDQLGKVLDSLDLNQDDNKLTLLAATLEVSGSGIILWDDFWKTASRLLTGASIESVLESPDPDEPPPLLQITDRPASSASTTTTNTTTNTSPPEETDEEMARRLASEWGWEDANSVGAVNGGSPINLPSDNEDAIVVASNSINNDAYNDELEGTQYMDDVMVEDSKPSAIQKPFDFETFGNAFPLYHYNGLRGGVLTPFRVTRLTPEEAVGASIALHRGGNGSSSSADLEDVIRTKWPSCVINWLGKPPPYID